MPPPDPTFRADASCLDLNGTWTVTHELDEGEDQGDEDDVGKAVKVKQDRSTVTDEAHVFASFNPLDSGAECPYGGSRGYYADVKLTGVKLSGTSDQCVLNEDVATYCYVASSWEPSLDGSTVEVEGEGPARTIHLRFLDQGWHLNEDDDGNITSCERRPENDTPFEVILARKPA